MEEQILPRRLQGTTIRRSVQGGLFQKPNYYDKPEGQDPWGKIWGLGKYAIATGLFTSINDCLFFTQTSNALETVNCVGHWMIPLIGLSTSFVSVTYIATNLRGKDDKLNYVFGALSCGPILHAWKKSTAFTLWGTAILTAAAIVKKDSVMNGWLFQPPIPVECGNYNKCYDFSLVSEEWPRRPI